MEKIWESIYCPNFFTTYNPFFLKDMSKALERMIKAINLREKIVIYGTCNIDGICGVSLLLLLLKYLNADVEYYIPDIMEEDHKISTDFINSHLKPLGAKLVITVGCSMESTLQVEYCKSQGIDVLVTDYHCFNNSLETIVVNPSQASCLYKFKDLAAAGIAYKLAQGISMYYNINCIGKYIDLVMLGTLSAKVPLIGENEIFVKEGLKFLHKTNNYGIRALMKIQRVNHVTISGVLKLISAVTPTVNAVGRMDNAKIAVELFTTSDGYRAEQIAKYLDKEARSKYIDSFTYRCL
jgi:single-stranded DNA-specific DHH superfamily exonuclease